mmetsp:Transcript_33826/g.95178  ORF Transcript_33826/g.95178 Transcript_33826/m.95178 type:complete len:271 (-) Transcript_33826:1457-2269(-)
MAASPGDGRGQEEDAQNQRFAEPADKGELRTRFGPDLRCRVGGAADPDQRHRGGVREGPAGAWVLRHVRGPLREGVAEGRESDGGGQGQDVHANPAEQVSGEVREEGQLREDTRGRGAGRGGVGGEALHDPLPCSGKHHIHWRTFQEENAGGKDYARRHTNPHLPGGQRVQRGGCRVPVPHAHEYRPGPGSQEGGLPDGQVFPGDGANFQGSQVRVAHPLQSGRCGCPAGPQLGCCQKGRHWTQRGRPARGGRTKQGPHGARSGSSNAAG